MLDSLDRKFGRLAVPNVTLYLIIGQVFVTLTSMLQLLDPMRLPLLPAAVLHGEPWRLFTFMFLPPPVGGRFSLMLLPFAWWILYLMGNALEEHWGALRYNLFLLVGFALTIAFAFITPNAYATNYYLMIGISLAFAWLNPNFEILLFFILPIKMKWLAVVSLAFMARDFFRGELSTRLQIGAALLTFLLFFGRSLLDALRNRQRTRAVQSKRLAEEKLGPQARHQCRICKKTDLTNPEMDFRYCSKCAGDECYCPEHIGNHEHVLEESRETQR
jgi:hypothetical protein